MKLYLVVIFVVLYSSQFDLNEASVSGIRSKRSMSWEACPENTTKEQCELYAKTKVTKNKICAEFQLDKINEVDMIVWKYCGPVICPRGERFYSPTKLDLSKPYPKCCPDCESERKSIKIPSAYI